MPGVTWAEWMLHQARLLAVPAVRVCSCGAPSGSAHDHNTGRVVGAAPRLPSTRARVSMAMVLGFIEGWDGPITIDEIAEAFGAEEYAVLREAVHGAAKGGYLSNRLGLYSITPKGLARARASSERLPAPRHKGGRRL